MHAGEVAETSGLQGVAEINRQLNQGNESAQQQEELIVSEEEVQDKDEGSDDEFIPGEIVKKQSSTKRQKIEWIQEIELW